MNRVSFLGVSVPPCTWHATFRREHHAQNEDYPLRCRRAPANAESQCVLQSQKGDAELTGDNLAQREMRGDR